MEWLDADISALHAAFEKRPVVLQSIGVDVAMHICNRVVDYLMLIILVKSNERRRSIRNKIDARFDVLSNGALQSVLLSIWDNFCRNLFPALKNSQQNGFVLWTMSANSACPLIVRPPNYMCSRIFSLGYCRRLI